MTSNEAADKLGLDPRASRSFRALCDRGCEPRVLYGLVLRLAGRDAIRLEQAQHPANAAPAISVSYTPTGLPISGGPRPVPEEFRRAIAAGDPDWERIVPPSSRVEMPIERPTQGHVEVSFTQREIARLLKKVQNVARTIERLNATGLARDVLSTQISPVLSQTFPERLLTYADTVGRTFRIQQQRRQSSESTRPARLIVHVRPLDSMSTALGPFDARDLKRLPHRFRKTATRLRQLYASALGRRSDEVQSRTLALASGIDVYADRVIQLMRDRHVGPKRRPDTVRLLWALLTYVYERTNRYHDREVAAVLEGVGFSFGSGRPRDRGAVDALTLQKWRNDHPKPAR